ncbi:MAG TPA: aminotransferase class V-fold PLP-dependent enzyme [Candidatus Sulfotelmatobacter sp.]|jgi:cysteine desulfurase/selenocysteine lyase|nr:aminotransferase class V-fold PLP-dependent enzyme [Candidatus Sulfotelmatobacter sp.]
MSTATAPQATPTTDWRQEWFEFENATYLNLAGMAPMPKVSLKAVQAALDAKKFPHHKPDSTFFEVPNRLRANLAQMIGAKPDEIALTTGASNGAAAVAYAITWKPGDEILTSKAEFPLQYTIWKPMEEREGISVRIVAPSGKFLAADDLIAALTPRTRLVSISHVRFDDGSMLDVARLAEACHKQGTLLLLDVSQSCGAVPMDAAKLGADFLICAGYKWLLGAFGTGFFWIKSELLASVRPAPFYWMAVAGSDNFAKLDFANPKPAESASRWDAPEWASHFNFNLAALDASVEFVLRAGAETVRAHNHALIDSLLSRLPADRCVAASPLDKNQRGPYGCFVARTPEKTAELYAKLRDENVFVSLRESKIRVSPYLFNTIQDIDRLISVITT